MKCYEKIDKTISKAALQKITQHLWYLTDKVSILSLFDDDVDQETKVKMVQNLTKEEEITHGIPSEELCGPLLKKKHLLPPCSTALKLKTVFYMNVLLCGQIMLRFKKPGKKFRH
ncbi:unnamed protein product [Parnassius mnemosyne]|uniref:Uncharacterized protein n=1 Tax=Parnassius mnemosyne TaxID=213953 RepID=A0AAV1LHM0_9NEOP